MRRAAAKQEATVSEVHRPVWAPDSIDIETPSVARMYDYLLVRHEALFDRVGVGYLHRWAIAVA